MPLPTKREARLAFQKHQAECCEQLAVVRTQQAQQKQQTLKERLVCSFLAE
jgi:hypothetical protein